ncbi:branched-subunit amino acid transport protein [Rhizobium sp. PP-F2F-G36]|nr:branched-subunit amino acid transport protein [Rhizobium sp. PP-F2F-G36]
MNMSMIAIIGACALVTIAVRSLPILFLSRFEMPILIRRWLAFIPVAIMAALIVADLRANPEVAPSGISITLVSAIAAGLVGLASRSLFLTVAVGVAGFMGFSLIL